MKGFLIEIRNKNTPDFVTGSGSLLSTVTPQQRYEMALRLAGKVRTGSYFAIEYTADWTDCTNPKFVEIKRYDLTGAPTAPSGELNPIATPLSDTVKSTSLTSTTLSSSTSSSTVPSATPPPHAQSEDW